MSEENNIMYKENDYIKTILCNDFTYIFDKDSGTFISWGKTKNEDPLFDPFSPETIKFILNNKFVFNEDLIRKLLNTKFKTSNIFIKDSYLLSTVSNIILDVKNIDNVNNDILKLIDFLNSFKLNVTLMIDYNSSLSLRDLIRIKTFKLDTIIINVYEFDNYLIDFIKMTLSKNIFLNCELFVSNKMINDLCNFLNNMPMLITTSINQIRKLSKSNLLKIKDIMVEKKLINCYISNGYKDFGKTYDEILTKEYDSYLFSCIYDFINETVYFDENTKDTFFIKFNDINNINDFWDLDKVKKIRKTLLKHIKA